MSTKVIFSSWPYTHALMGIHNLIPMLAGDMLSRFHRLMHDDVVFISGCDEYGERMERKAHTENVSPRELADLNYAKVKSLLDSFNIELSFFRRTTDSGHRALVQERLTDLQRNGVIEERLVDSLFCPACDQFVPDVFVLGSCAACGRFDNLNDHYASVSCAANGPIEFRDAVCGVCRLTGVHTVLTSESAKRWVTRIDTGPQSDMTPWTELARSETTKALPRTSDWISISRSVEWGIPLPFDTDQTLFSWVDSLLGNVTAFMIEDELRSIDPRDVSAIYCMGRDNVPFYSILYPSLLRSLNADFLTPAVIVANHDICFDGLPCSKSQSRTIDLESAIGLLPTDYWRAYLISIFPRTANADFSPIFFDEFVRVALKNLDNYIGEIHQLCVRHCPAGHNEAAVCGEVQMSRLVGLLDDFHTRLAAFDFAEAMSLIFRTVAESNSRIKHLRVSGSDAADACPDLLREIFVLAPLMSIFMPDASRRIRDAFRFEHEDRALTELAAQSFDWRVEEGGFERIFTDSGLRDSMAKIREMVVAIEFGNGIDYSSDKHPIRIKWDACNCETWYQAGAVVSDQPG